ncbi:chloride channel CLIC-like protein 1 [Clarias gariepinus]
MLFMVSTFRSMFAVFFIINLVWNWFFLYKIACAENQAKIVKWKKMMDKCTGGTKNDWIDNLKEWYRTTWTLQDDPCKEYFEVQIVYPILRVPPMKVITMTLTTLITDPVKHLGQGINEFLRALLKDLPITLQILLLILLVLSNLVVLYSVSQAAVRWHLRGRRKDPSPDIANQPDTPPNGHHREQQRLYEETQQNDTLVEAAAQDPDRHAVAEPQMLSHGPEEEIEASAHNTDMTHSLTTSNEPSPKSAIEDNI